MVESNEHKALVNLIIDYLDDREEGRSTYLLQVDNRPNHDRPKLIGSHRPDLYAEILDGDDRYGVIGEAETDVGKCTVKQLTAFAKEVHGELVQRLVVAAPLELGDEIISVLTNATNDDADICSEEVSYGDQTAAVITLEGIDLASYYAGALNPR